jgi:hypothetical protein
MASKIEAATSAVAPGSKCTACVVASGADLHCVRAVFGPDTKYGNRGTLFVTPGSGLEKQALKDLKEEEVNSRSRQVDIDFSWISYSSFAITGSNCECVGGGSQ